MVDKDIKQNLKILGLRDKEITVYITLSLSPEMSILELSKETGIPRTSVYRICSSLAERGFIEWIKQENSQEVQIVPPEKLTHLVAAKQTELDIYQSALSELQQMVNLPLSHVPKTQVRFYQGKEGFKQLIWNTLQAKDEIIGYSTYGRREVVGDKFYEKYVQEFRARGLTDKVITNEDALDYLKKYLDPTGHQQEIDDVRVIPKSKFYVSGDTTIYNNIYAVSFWRQGEIVGIEIENPEVVKTQRSIFNLMWEVGEPLQI